jgi:hypothetical protein
MDKYIGPLVQLATVAGVVWIVLAIVWLVRRPLTTFKKMALAFMCVGAVVPAAILPVWDWINLHGSLSAMGRVQDIALAIWPTSIELMALDSTGPPPWSAITLVYTLSGPMELSG